MVLKFLMAGLITAALAGSAVYFGLDDDMIASLRETGSVAERQSSDTRNNIIDRLLKRGSADDKDTTDKSRNSETMIPDEGQTQALGERPEPPKPIQRVWSDTAYDTLLIETEKLEIPDARDDAYLNILNMALANENYTVADTIVPRLTSPELRDTARQRIGISHARAGRLEEAFAVLEDLDVEALTDPIRLEIIRSVAQPSR